MHETSSPSLNSFFDLFSRVCDGRRGEIVGSDIPLIVKEINDKC
jgi:hypothetical protein